MIIIVKTPRSQNKKRKVDWKGRARCTTGLCGASQKKGWRKSAHSSLAGKISSLTLMKRNRKRKRKKKEREQNEGTSRAERTIQVVVEARQHQNGSERSGEKNRTICRPKVN